jgi:DNA-binding PucR family transcriptional regulator
LIKAFEATLNEVEKRGPFDTHLQAQTAYLGPSKTVQNAFAGKRNPDKVTYWVPIEQLSEFCKTTFGAVPPRKNESDKNLETQLKMYVKNHQLEDRILNMYKEDAKRYFDITGKNNNNGIS